MTNSEVLTPQAGTQMPPLSWGRRAGLLAALLLAVALQTTFFSHLAWRGVVPDLAMLVVIGLAITRGPMVGMVWGFGAGLLIDLAPPADHVAGRWALALVVVGHLAGTFAAQARPGVWGRLPFVAGCSFVATSLVALTGLVVDDMGQGIGDLLAVVLIALVLDVAASFVVLPLTFRLAGATPARSLSRGRAWR